MFSPAYMLNSSRMLLVHVGIVWTLSMLALFGHCLCWHCLDIVYVGIVWTLSMLALFGHCLCWHCLDIVYVGIVWTLSMLALFGHCPCVGLIHQCRPNRTF